LQHFITSHVFKVEHAHRSRGKDMMQEHMDANDHEAELMLRAQQTGDPALLEVIYERYIDRIYGYCLRRISDPQEAEDLTSQVFMKVLIALHQYRGGSVAAWLFQIAHNVITDYWRQKRPHVPLEVLEGAVVDSETDLSLEGIIADQEAQRIQVLLQQIPSEHRAMLDLKLESGLSAAQIGAIVGKSATAVRSALHRTLRHLHRLYQQSELENKERQNRRR
jgi:RNA polymerase sigma-70 factor, ECF subfamily